MAAAPAGIEITFANHPDDGDFVTVCTLMFSQRLRFTEQATPAEKQHLTDRAILKVQGAVRAMVAEWDELS